MQNENVNLPTRDVRGVVRMGAGNVWRTEDVTSSIFRMWKDTCKVIKEDEKARLARKNRIKKANAELEERIEEAYQRHDAREIWQTARNLSGTGVMGKKRRRNTPTFADPTLDEWMEHVSRKGPQC